jgi:solute carrier family 25, member 33/36
MCGAVVTSPFDVVKTRLQSSMFNDHHHISSSGGAATVTITRSRGLLWSFVETGHILRCRLFNYISQNNPPTYIRSRDIYRYESPAALFKGLVPTLVGVIPARSINFFTYGNGKQIISQQFNGGRESSAVHLFAAAWAGIVTGTATNPIWMVKTRMQLSASEARPFANSWDCIKDIARKEGVRGFYKGLTASYLGVTEGTIQWVLYEKGKQLTMGEDSKLGAWGGMIGSAGGAKMIASLITYPHEVSFFRDNFFALVDLIRYRCFEQDYGNPW